MLSLGMEIGNSLYPSNSAALVDKASNPRAASQNQLQTQIAREVNNAPAGAEVDVQYQYQKGPNGELIAVAAKVTVTQTVERNSGEVKDIIDLSEGAEAGLSDAEKAYLRQLQAADTSVRTHEALHFRAAGGLGQLPEYQTVTGPDGKQYAVAGSVSVSGTRGADDEKAAREAQTLVGAATAPGDASAQDISAAKQFSRNLNAGQSPLEATSEAEKPNPPGALVNLIA
jgi:hypothetical protein